MNSILLKKPTKQTNTDTFWVFFYLRAKSQNEIYSTCCRRWTNFAARTPSHACKPPLLLQKNTKRSQLSQSSRRSSWPDEDWCQCPGSLLGWEGMWDDLLLQLQRTALLPKVRNAVTKCMVVKCMHNNFLKKPSQAVCWNLSPFSIKSYSDLSYFLGSSTLCTELDVFI